MPKSTEFVIQYRLLNDSRWRDVSSWTGALEEGIRAEARRIKEREEPGTEVRILKRKVIQEELEVLLLLNSPR